LHNTASDYNATLPQSINMNFFVRLLLSAVAVLIAGWVLPGVHLDSFWTALVVAAVLAFLNSFVKPILLILTLPITIVTLGLFLLVINTLIILAASYLVDGFHVDGFFSGLLFSLIVSVTRAILDAFAQKKEEK